MKKTCLSVLLLLMFVSVWGQQQYRKPIKPTKNVILMIPDGTSIGVVSAARWYQIYNKLGGDNLAIDPYICGTVKTFCSNAPIGDSAPTTSCYMTGMPQKIGNVSIYPEADPAADLIPVDPAKTYQPLSTILEAAKYQQNKSTGLVVTVEFPHATPADCAAHYYDRGNYKYIGSQMAYNNIDVVFGGGNSIITDDIKQHFKNTGTTLIQDDIKAFRDFNGKEKVWALFCENDHPYDLDRDNSQIPSLSEMTQKAIERLSKDENGFFLMVEGSKIDWAAHGNDAVACITEYLAFDKAVAAAIDFAKKDGETTVIILPDHGNSGFTIGRRDLEGYAKASIDKLFKNVSQYKRTSGALETILLNTKPEDFKSTFKEYTGIDLTEEEYNLLLSSKNYKESDYMKVSNSVNMASSISKIMDEHTYFGFTTGGHTGEEVFLAAYHPQGDIPVGMNTNIEINHYLFDALGLKTSLDEMNDEIFAKHTDVFKGLNYTIDKSGDFPVLKVTKGKVTLSIPAFKSVAYLNKQPISLRSVTIYIDKNDTFYIPRSLANKL